ncbi:glycosyltransferase family 2 protein [Streptomyces sp. AV19]|uniref:glycosyltransferase family 2 protein n=1 Tax=Streptomyces sp. AV19 TaxID=2793068 RepID=UPI0018FE43FD|nr:glycosyltransferase family 2 protein [Streptomyces sp. AV19]MBH1936611.1 glycosyltransferase family 2 protein [Streptomyces sp. AV19]MDG4532673.1 glycosyltransferase family 2 protein [Streptomyces sp. AV19]
MSSFLRPAAGQSPDQALGSEGRSDSGQPLEPPAQYRPVTSQFAIAPPVSVVIPAMNEAENLPYVFKTLPSWIHEVVLVDGNSTDDTVKVARELWPSVKVVEQRGKGKGDALITGFAACSGEIIVMVDADGSADGNEIVSYVSALVGGADFAKGSRFANGGGTDDMTPVRKLGNRVLCSIVNQKFGARYTDLCYGYNAFWKRVLDDIALDCAGFEVETLMNIRVVKAGLKVQEIPSHEFVRIHGASNLRAVRDGLRVLRVILHERGSRRRKRPGRPALAIAPAASRGEVS